MYASLSFLFHCMLCAKDIVRMYAYFKNAKLTYHKHDNMLNLLFLQVSMINCFYRLRLKISSYLVHHIMCHDCSIQIENILVFLSYTMSPPIHFQYVLPLLSCLKNNQHQIGEKIRKNITLKYKTQKCNLQLIINNGTTDFL